MYSTIELSLEPRQCAYFLTKRQRLFVKCGFIERRLCRYGQFDCAAWWRTRKRVDLFQSTLIIKSSSSLRRNKIGQMLPLILLLLLFGKATLSTLRSPFHDLIRVWYNLRQNTASRRCIEAIQFHTAALACKHHSLYVCHCRLPSTHFTHFFLCRHCSLLYHIALVLNL